MSDEKPLTVTDLHKQMIPPCKRPPNQPALPATSVELNAAVAGWKTRALAAEEKLEKLEEALDKAMCSVVGHNWYDYDRGSYCDRCGEDK